MRVVLQRVAKASVSVEGKVISAIEKGMLVLLGIVDEDADEDVEWLVRKILNLRIFDDESGVMNRSVMDVTGDIIVVSQFTLHACTKKGNRPSYIKAAKSDVAVPLYEKFIEKLQTEYGRKIGRGIFGADMQVDLLNDGPVTILIDTKNKE